MFYVDRHQVHSKMDECGGVYEITVVFYGARLVSVTLRDGQVLYLDFTLSSNDSFVLFTSAIVLTISGREVGGGER